jgi:hypothetical protein
MSDEWNFYFCNIDDKFASIFVDLGIIDSTPIDTLPFMAYIRLKMNLPNDNGVSSREEYDAIDQIEEALNAKFTVDLSQYVGRCTTDSYRDFFFYISKPKDWMQSVTDLMLSFPDYQYTADIREEKDWSTYRLFLYPDKAARQSIDNRRICLLLEENGDLMNEAREIEHWAYFTDEHSRSEFVSEVIQLGFSIGSLEVSDIKDTMKYSARFCRDDIPSFMNIDNVTLPLFYLAINNNGYYDGWGTAIIK